MVPFYSLEHTNFLWWLCSNMATFLKGVVLNTERARTIRTFKASLYRGLGGSETSAFSLSAINQVWTNLQNDASHYQNQQLVSESRISQNSVSQLKLRADNSSLWLRKCHIRPQQI